MRAAERNNYKRGWFRRRPRRLSRRRFNFADESAVNTAMTRRYGRAPRGERAYDSAPRNYGAHTSVIGAVGLRGLVATLTVKASTREALEGALTAALGLVTKADIRGWFQHCGYSLAPE